MQRGADVSISEYVKGRPTRLPFPFNPFQSVDNRYAAERALDNGIVAAAVLALVHAYSGLSIYVEEAPPVDTLVSSDWRVLVAVNMGLAAVAVALYAALARTRSTVVAMLLLLWSIFDLNPWLTLPLYGHMSMIAYPIFAILASITAVRATRRMARGFDEAPPPPGPLTFSN
jgi:hypothetical protein